MTVVRLTAAAALVLAGVFVVLHVEHHTPVPVHLTGKVSNHGTRTVQSNSTVSVELENTSFKPTFVVAKPGAHLTLALHAEGFHAHTFTVPALGIDVTLPPNGSMTVPVTLPDSGVVSYYCRFHRDMGMQGAFVIR